MNLVTLLDPYELYTRSVQQMVAIGRTDEQEWTDLCVMKMQARLEIERFVADIESKVST